MRAGLKNRVGEMKARGITPGLAVILVGDDPASQIYVGHKIKACAQAGITSFEHRLPANTSEADILTLISKLNNDETVHGILLQLPLPSHLDETKMILAIGPDKDVDGLHPVNAGRLVAGLPGHVPCTPLGAMHLIKTIERDLSGKNALVMGRSLLFGKPMAQLLLAANCTVTMAHSRTQDLAGHCRRADILVAAVGQARMVKQNWIKPGAIVIDVGITRMDDGTLAGDVDYDAAKMVAGAITPVPGGVGPMTIAYLLQNTLNAAKTLAQ